MKIIIISPAHPLRGGIAASSERLAREFQDMGHEVVIYSFSLQYPSFLFPGKTQFSETPTPTDLQIKTTINSVNAITWVRTAWKIALEKPELVVTRFWIPFMGPALGTVLWLSKLFGGNAHRIGLVDNLIPHEKRFGDRLFSRYFTACNQSFLALSDSVARDISSFVPRKRVQVSPHPIYDHYGTRMSRKMACITLSLDVGKRWLLFFGFIRAYKGLDLLLHAMQYIKDPLVYLVIAGECYEDWSPYQAIIDQHGLAERVVLHTDYISDDKVRNYFSACELVVQPYKTATQSGITQVALHFNKPTVVTRVGGLPEMVLHQKTGYVVEPEPHAIARAVSEYLVLATSGTEPMFDEIEREKERFSWAILAAKLLEK